MKRLLIVDDDAGMRAALETRFRRVGWLVDAAVNGAEALGKFRPGLHALVITDVRMPGRDGFELLREIQISSPSTAVILLTAYGGVPEAVDAMRNGACDYGKIGDWIEKLGFASEQDVTSALALQWGCPVASTVGPAIIDLADRIPLALLEAFQMLPWNFAASTNTLYVAFGERVDHAALYAIEKILDCRTQPCVAPRRAIAASLEQSRLRPRPSDIEFANIRDLAEMSRISSSYIARLSPDEVRLTRVGQFIWIHLSVRAVTTNLVFSLSCDTRSNLLPFRQATPPVLLAPQTTS